MTTIERHKIDIDLNDMIARTGCIHEKLLNKLPADPSVSSYLYANCMEGFNYEMFNVNKEKAKYYFNIAQQAIVAHFRFVSFPDEKIEIKIGDINLKSKGYETDDSVSTGYWRMALALSVIKRDWESIGHLIDVPESVLRKSNSISDEFNFTYVKFLKSLWASGSTDYGKKLLETYDAIEEKNIKIQDYSLVLRMISPQLAMYGDALSNNVVEFNKDLEQALLSWKSICEEGAKGSSRDGFFNLEITSIAAFACIRELPIEVESDYMPKELVEGKWKI
jgi:hypothetical protein